MSTKERTVFSTAAIDIFHTAFSFLWKKPTKLLFLYWLVTANRCRNTRTYAHTAHCTLHNPDC